MFWVERLDVARVIGRAAARHLHQFAVQVNDVAAAGTFMQVIYILCHNRHGMFLFKLCHKLVPKARLRAKQFLTAHIIELRNEFRVASPAFRRRHILYVVLVPQSAFSAHTRSSQHYYSHNCPFFD